MTETTTPAGQHIENWLNEEVTGKEVTRRDFLKGTGVFIVSCSMAGVIQMVNPQAAAADFSALVNPDGLKNVIEGNLLHSMSRTLYEEVKFNRSKVTSTDWTTYPIATIMDVPDRIDKVLLNEPQLPPDGAGEETSAQTQPAIANAFFDATGVRIRRLPFTADRVMATLKAR